MNAPCPTCKGERTIAVPVRFAGEAYGCFVEERCDDCDGTGEVEAACEHCENVAPLDVDGLCACCGDIPDECGLVEVEHLGRGSIAA